MIFTINIGSITYAQVTPPPKYDAKGGRVYKNGKEIKLRGIAWSGSEGNKTYMPNGLWQRGYKSMIQQMKSVGFNAIRFPFCPMTLKDSKVSYFNTQLNPDLVGKNSLQIMDIIVEEFDRQGFYILMDHHSIDCADLLPLWYTKDYPEKAWIEDLKFVAKRYAKLQNFIGIEVKNEPWGASTWSNSRPATDFNKAAERAGKEILTVNPNIMIFVDGIENNPECDGPYIKWWGGNIIPIKCFPIDKKMIPENKLILSPHVYGPDIYNQEYFKPEIRWENMNKIWNEHIGFALKTHNVVISEFGGKFKPGTPDRIWQKLMIDYMIYNKICNSFYWSWNFNSHDTEGILNSDWNSINIDKLNNLKRLWNECV
ncbi:MAG: glycoside hydrolase family 5 protein [Patescibacteria group bacterium]